MRFDFKLVYVLTGDKKSDKRTLKLAMARIDQLRGKWHMGPQPSGDTYERKSLSASAVAESHNSSIQPAGCPSQISDESHVSLTRQLSSIRSLESSGTQSRSATGSQVSQETRSRSIAVSLDSRDLGPDISVTTAVIDGVGTERTAGAAPMFVASPCIQSTSSAQAFGINTFQSAVPMHATSSRGPSVGNTHSEGLSHSHWMRPEPSSHMSISSKRQHAVKPSSHPVVTLPPAIACTLLRGDNRLSEVRARSQSRKSSSGTESPVGEGSCEH